MVAYEVTIERAPSGGEHRFGFRPSELSIKKGDTVAWKNNTSVEHTATSDDDGVTFDTGSIEPQTTSDPQTINHESGPVPYSCTIHPDMKATLTVE